MRALRLLIAAAVLATLAACLAAAVCAPAGATVGGAAAAARPPRRTPSNSGTEWGLALNGPHRRPGIPATAARLLRAYSGVWIGGRHDKVVYLTFDESTEFGTTKRIITILDRAHVKASFFLTGIYIRHDPGIARRLVAHGELVCNHSDTHPSMVAKAGSVSAFTEQLRAPERAFHAATGGTLARFFRPPFGAYSPRSLQLTERLGYTTVFWSFAHYDYDEAAQPAVSVTLHRIVSAAAPGVVYLLHASSRSNVSALPQAIREIARLGYRFGTLDKLH